MPMHVEHALEGGALTAVVVEGEQLEPGIVGGAQVALYLVFIGQRLQPSARHEEVPVLSSHAVVVQEVAENLEVKGAIDAGVLGYLAEIGEGAPLALFVGDDGRLVGLGALVVAGEGNLRGIVVVGMGRVAVPVESAGTALDMILGAVVPRPASAHGSPAIDLGGVVLPHGRYPVVAVADPVAGGLVAGSHHEE